MIGVLHGETFYQTEMKKRTYVSDVMMAFHENVPYLQKKDYM